MEASELHLLSTQIASDDERLSAYGSELHVLGWVIGDAGQFASDSDVTTAEAAVRRALRKYPVKFRKGAFFASAVLLCVADTGSPVFEIAQLVLSVTFQQIGKFTEAEAREVQRLSRLTQSEALKSLARRLVSANTNSQPEGTPGWFSVLLSLEALEILRACPKKPSKAWAKRVRALEPPPQIRLDHFLQTLCAIPAGASAQDIRMVAGLVATRFLLQPDHRIEIFLILKQMSLQAEILAVASEVLRMEPVSARDLFTLCELLPKVPQSRAFLRVLDQAFPRASRLRLRLSAVASRLAVESEEVVIRFPQEPQSSKRPQPEINVSGSFPEQYAEDLARQLVKYQGHLQACHRVLVEELLATPLQFSPEEFEATFLIEPVRSDLAKRLIWTCDREFMVWNSNHWQTIEGNSVTFEIAEKIALWHPIQNGPGTVEVLREYCVANDLKQPFKQAFREVYLLTDAERTTFDHSRRFYGQVLKLEQFMALLRAKGWSGTETYAFFGPEEDAALRKFPEHGISAHFGFRQAPTNFTAFMSDPYLLVTSEAVWFECDGKTLPLDQIPAHLFSEAMRDVDMFVSVSSIGTDPTWAINDPSAGAGSLWHRMAFGELLPSAQTRGEYLRMLLPKLGFGDRLQVDGKFLFVQGRRHRYKIHLGSSNILIQPNDQYLCIVGVPSGSKTNLVFDGDKTLSLILSKAFMLMADDKIKDPTILSQLPK
jgi:hypothetical protein